jgi:hypothetical protein
VSLQPYCNGCGRTTSASPPTRRKAARLVHGAGAIEEHLCETRPGNLVGKVRSLAGGGRRTTCRSSAVGSLIAEQFRQQLTVSPRVNDAARVNALAYAHVIDAAPMQLEVAECFGRRPRPRPPVVNLGSVWQPCLPVGLPSKLACCDVAGNGTQILPPPRRSQVIPPAMSVCSPGLPV